MRSLISITAFEALNVIFPPPATAMRFSASRSAASVGPMRRSIACMERGKREHAEQSRDSHANYYAIHFRYSVIQARLLRRARMQHDAIAHADRLAFRQRPGLLDESERRRRKVTVIAREPRTRRPGVLRMVHDSETFHDIRERSCRDIRTSVPVCRRSLRADAAFRVHQTPP